MRANFEYKCRRCGAVHVGCSVDEGASVAHQIMTHAKPGYGTATAGGPIPTLEVHVCQQRRGEVAAFGVSDLVGFFVETD